ncbi:MAG: Endonuclease IV [Anaerolineae bacterium]|jgi:deoxyribonuclease-4|nr:MAG: Endonuclease IV [Anaerolineae bacterium]
MALSFRFGTVGSPKSTPPKPGGSIGAIQRLRELDLDALELGWVQAVRVSESTCAEIRAAAQAQDVSISVHAPYFINLNANEDEWPKSRKRLMDAAYYGNLAGATDIIFHPGSYFGKDPSEVLPIALERLEGCVAELRQMDNPVILRPETMGKSAMLGSLQDTLAMSQAIQGVKPCIDFAHLHARAGDGSMNSYEEWSRVLEQIARTLGEGALQDLHIHLSGIEYSSKGEREHLKIEDADLNIAAIFGALKDFACRGRILCESPVLEDDALLLRQMWMEISGETL